MAKSGALVSPANSVAKSGALELAKCIAKSGALI
jgi:hypothetical protein